METPTKIFPLTKKIIYPFKKRIYRVSNLIKTLSTIFASVIYRLFEPATFKIQTDTNKYSLGETIMADLFINTKQDLVVKHLVLSLICFEHFSEVFIRSEVPKSGPGIITRNQQDIPLDPINTQVIRESSKTLLENTETLIKNLHLTRKQNHKVTKDIEIPAKLPAHSVGSKLQWEIHLTINLEKHSQSKTFKYPIEVST